MPDALRQAASTHPQAAPASFTAGHSNFGQGSPSDFLGRPGSGLGPHHSGGGGGFGSNHFIGDKKASFDDKIATSDNMKYTDAKKHEWVKNLSNHFISKVYEMKHFLPLAEGFQSQVIEHHHVLGLAGIEVCIDIDPAKLSLDLWGFLNLCRSGEEKVAFNNVDPGNGFDAWRRIVVPI